jgi:hypothetical protein
MRLPTILTIALALVLFGIGSGIGSSNPGSMSFARLAILGPVDNSPTAQTPAPGGPPPGAPPEGGGTAPSAPPGGTAPKPGASKDTTGGTPAAAPTDPKIAEAMAGIRDYEVTYDKTKSHAENTPADLKGLGVTYAGEESTVAKRTEALKKLNLKQTLADRYNVTEEKFGAKEKEDFAPNDPDQTLNYFQPRKDPYSIPESIPKELRPKYEGTGLEGEVDPALLKQLRQASFTANLRYVPISIVGTMENGPYRVCFFTIAGSGRTFSISQGESRCIVYQGIPVSVGASQISEDYVVLTLTGAYDYGCNYPATNPVIRTFHVSR